jgi:hypothetical protein
MKKAVFVLLSLFLINLIAARPSLAVSKPNFPACNSPEGTIKIHYPTGTHGIAGSTATYTGSDTVYLLSDVTLTQCFCSENGSGIQTNWWKVSSLDQEEITKLQAEGWYLIPDGSAWGLDNAPYMAFNTSYSCGGSPNGTGGGNSNSNNFSSSNSVVSSLQGVLGLAFTGNAWMVYGSGIAGLLFLLVGLLMELKKKR